MIIHLTKEQGDELLNDFWDVPYTVTLGDGTVLETSTGADDIREIPVPFIGELGQITDANGNVTSYAMCHPELTWEDEVVVKTILDDRAAFTELVRKADKADRATLRSDKRTELREEARKSQRVAARVAQRQSDRQAARQDYRRELRQDARIAERIAARQAERKAEQDAFEKQ